VAWELGLGLARELARARERAQVQELALALGPVQGHRQPGADWAGSHRLRRSRRACPPTSARGFRFECAGDRRSIGLCRSLESAFGLDVGRVPDAREGWRKRIRIRI